VGSRQLNTVKSKLVINAKGCLESVMGSIRLAKTLERAPERNFGDGKSSKKFAKSLSNLDLWETNIQKQFRDNN
jgi:hypothetical protein